MSTGTQIHTIYRKADGTRVPSVTTYLDVLAKPALIHWAWELGVAGLDYRKVRDQAGDIGTLVHYLILSHLKGEEPDLSTYTPQDIAAAASSMSKFKEWLEIHELEPILLETPLVSELFSYGGTFDFYGKDNDKPTLLDFKTSGDVYPENFYQLAAYMMLLTEHGYEVKSARIVRVSRAEGESFDDRPAGKLENHWQIFLACQQIYELRKAIKRTSREE